MRIRRVLTAGISHRPPVEALFEAIAPRYDLLNRVLSFGLDRTWRAAAAEAIAEGRPARVLDLAAGTGDLAQAVRRVLPEAAVVLADPVSPMLSRARGKGEGAAAAARAEALPFPDGIFDAVGIAFGLRNAADRARALAEVRRVLSPGGRFVVLDFSVPPAPIFRRIYLAYFRRVLPFVGGLVSGRPDAYRYLPASVLAWPSPGALAAELADAGLRPVRLSLRSAGIVFLLVAER